MNELSSVAITSESELRAYLSTRMPVFEPDIDAFQHLKTFDMLVVFFDWQNRLVSAQPRRVHCSKALLANELALTAKYLPGMNRIVKNLLRGETIQQHLSREVKYAFAPSRNLKGKDLLLNDWGIHHLHLSTKIEDDGFVERDGPLLFALFRDADAYLINILPHQRWTELSLCEIMVREWPEAELMWKMNGLTPNNTQFTNDELKK